MDKPLKRELVDWRIANMCPVQAAFYEGFWSWCGPTNEAEAKQCDEDLDRLWLESQARAGLRARLMRDLTQEEYDLMMKALDASSPVVYVVDAALKPTAPEQS